nr:MAG TPA: hypothetical protein [Caudoviricetes sp.]
MSYEFLYINPIFQYLIMFKLNFNNCLLDMSEI